jgi:hypothetical protein
MIFPHLTQRGVMTQSHALCRRADSNDTAPCGPSYEVVQRLFADDIMIAMRRLQVLLSSASVQEPVADRLIRFSPFGRVVESRAMRRSENL